MSYFKETKLTDGYGFDVENTPMGEQRVVSPVRLAGTVFSSGTTIDSNFWTTTLVSGATATTNTTQIELATNTGSNASAIVQSVREGRYVGGTANRFRAVLRLPDVGTVNNYRRWGAFNGSDGNFFFMSGTTFGVGTIKAGVETKIPTGSFNGVLGSSYSPGSIVKTYETYWTNSNVWFVLGNEILHTYPASYDTWTNIQHLPVRLENINLNNASGNITLNCRSATINRLGELTTNPTYKQYTAGSQVLKYGPGVLHRIAVNDMVSATALQIYDNIDYSGATIGIITPGAKAVQPFTMEYNFPFKIGLALSGTGTWNCTIIYE